MEKEVEKEVERRGKWNQDETKLKQEKGGRRFVCVCVCVCVCGAIRGLCHPHANAGAFHGALRIARHGCQGRCNGKLLRYVMRSHKRTKSNTESHGRRQHIVVSTFVSLWSLYMAIYGMAWATGGGASSPILPILGRSWIGRRWSSSE